jgi:phosphoribosylamine--glycine ligase
MKVSTKERTKVKVGLVGKDGRTTAIRRKLQESDRLASVHDLASGKLGPTAQDREDAKNKFRAALKAFRPDFVVVGPEEPLEQGFVDIAQAEFGIPSVGPTSTLAQLESSKAYTRRLLEKHGIPGNPKFRVFDRADGIERYLDSLGNFVVKPNGLTGGKGVKVSDVHLFSTKEATDYCKELLRSGHNSIVIEEKLEGEEFSLQSFCDGTHVEHMPIVQDHKRVSVGDTGPNTGGMGSYSCSDWTLLFLEKRDLQAARFINEEVLRVVKGETGQPYKGVLYGGFIATADGVKLIEYNVRFGDPEALNVLSVLQTDFADICESIINETLDRIKITWAPRATVCKYLVPHNYPDNPVKNVAIDTSRVPPDSENLKVFDAAVEERNGRKYLTGSRAVAVVGIGDNLEQAERIAEDAANLIEGPLDHRSDIGTRELIDARVTHMRKLRSGKLSSSALIQ